MRYIRKPIHRFILWYTEKVCGGDFHTKPYGPSGRYIVSMNDSQYNRYTHNARDVD
jgi:deoxyribodipyrimidine photolyase-like uncharacterized protein